MAEFTKDDIEDERLCQSRTVEFDVAGRYLMGFMGSTKDEKYLVELGPIVSRKIISNVVSNIKTFTDDNIVPGGDIKKIVRKVCNDDNYEKP